MIKMLSLLMFSTWCYGQTNKEKDIPFLRCDYPSVVAISFERLLCFNGPGSHNASSLYRLFSAAHCLAFDRFAVQT